MIYSYVGIGSINLSYYCVKKDVIMIKDVLKHKKTMNMKKLLKILLTLTGVVVTILAVILCIGPGDPIILSVEEEVQQQHQQEKLYLGSNIKDFDTQTIQGYSLNYDSLKDNDLIVVDLWSTWCTSCIAEMPMLNHLVTQLPENVSMIGVCVDTADEEGKRNNRKIKRAQKICAKQTIHFPILIPDKIIAQNLTNKTTIFPTLLVLNGKGEVVAGPYNGQRTVSGILEFIDHIKK